MIAPQRYYLAVALVSLCSASPLAELADKPNDCGFKPSTTYTAGDAALTAVVDHARVTGSLRDTLLQGGWSPIDGCTSWCCKCAATISDSPDYYPTACKTTSLAPETTAPAQLELRDLAFQTRTITRDGSVIFVPMINFADMATACGFGHNTAGACEPGSKVIDVKVTRTLDDGMLFISDELSTQYAAGPTHAAGPPSRAPFGGKPFDAPFAAPFAAPAPQVSPVLAAHPKPGFIAPAPGNLPGPSSPIVTTIPAAPAVLPPHRPAAVPPFAGNKPSNFPNFPNFGPSSNGGSPFGASANSNGGPPFGSFGGSGDKPPFGAFGGLARLPDHFKFHDA